jgi:CubicO group peptidase (beta-lactamase class C family)
VAHGYARADGRGPGAPQAPGGAGGAVRDVSGEVEIGNPSGGAYSTVGDLYRFARALLGGRLVGAALVRTFLTGTVAVTRPGGSPGDRYAYGFEETTVAGVRVVGHGGGAPGYEAQLDLRPDTGDVVVVLCNQDGVLRGAVRRARALLTAARPR